MILVGLDVADGLELTKSPNIRQRRDGGLRLAPGANLNGVPRSLVLIQRAAAVPKLNCSNQQGVGICGLRSGGADAAVPAMASSSDPDKLMTKADKL